MKFGTPLLLAAALVLASACTRMKVACERTASFDFPTTCTYRWVPASSEILGADDTLVDDEIQAALARALANKGWRMAEDDARLEASYYIKIREHLEYSSNSADEREFSGGLVFGSGSKGWNYQERQPDLNAYTIETGKLILSLVDTHSGKTVWQGTLTARIDRSLPLDKRQEQYLKIARRLVAEIR